MPDRRLRAAQVNNDKVDASVQATDAKPCCVIRARERARGAVQIADLARVDTFLGRAEVRAAGGPNLHAHELAWRPWVQRNDVDLVTRAALDVARDDAPAPVDEPRNCDVFGECSASLPDRPHATTVFGVTYRGLMRVREPR